MPRIVVPMFSPLEQLLSSARSSAMCQGKITCARSLEHQVLVDRNAAAEQAVDLLQDAGRVDHDSAGDDALHAWGEDAAGNERQFVGLTIADDGMAGIAAPLIADDDVVLFGQDVDELAFGFVAPLQTDDASNTQSSQPLPCRAEWTRNTI